MLQHKKLTADLCVIGGGMAGISAAVSAARAGISVVLMHERPVLGGNASSEIRMWICGAEGENMRETGLVEEIFLKNFYYNPTKNPYIFDNILLETVTAEKNITLLLNCTCMDAKTEHGEFENGRTVKITEVTGYSMTAQTFYDVSASFYADCSGDSILAPLTGAEFMLGREGSREFGEDTHVKEHDSLTMGNTCLIQARESERKIPFVRPESAAELNEEDFLCRHPDLYSEYENFWYLELGGNSDTIGESEEIAGELKKLALGTWAHIKETPEYKAGNFELSFLGALAGKRESRRYKGEYIMTQRDISGGTRFDDTVAFGGWPIDDHFPDGFYHKGHPNHVLSTASPYPIPYRILYSSTVENLFFAGRNISATHTALSSLRVMATCSVMGQAVGFASAVAVKNSLTPHGVYTEKLGELQKLLLDSDCFLPHFKREISPLCLSTPISGVKNGEKLKNGEDRANKIYGTSECGTKIPLGKEISYSLGGGYVKSVHLVFDSDLDRTTLPGGQCERTHATRAVTLLKSPDIYMPKTLAKSFVLTVKLTSGEEIRIAEEKNLRRCYHIEIGKKTEAVSLTVNDTWGEEEDCRIMEFDFA